MNVTRCCVGEVCPQPVEEVRQCGFRVHFDFGELWGAVTSSVVVVVVVVVVVCCSVRAQAQEEIPWWAYTKQHDWTRDVWSAASSQTNFSENCAFQGVQKPRKLTDAQDYGLFSHIVIPNYGKDLGEQAVQRLKPQASQEIEESLKQGGEYTWLYSLCS